MLNNPTPPNDESDPQMFVSKTFVFMKILMSAFGLIFGLIGFVVLAFVWIVPAGQNNPFNDLPIFFRLFVSCIALAFVGFSALWVTMLWKIMPAMQSRHPLFAKLRSFNPAYMQTIHKRSIPTACPSCGAKFVQEEENAPATCSFCGSALPHGNNSR
jgi:hypothetical protein